MITPLCKDIALYIYTHLQDICMHIWIYESTVNMFEAAQASISSIGLFYSEENLKDSP